MRLQQGAVNTQPVSVTAEDQLLETKKSETPVTLCAFDMFSDVGVFSCVQWKNAKADDLMDSKLRCVFELPSDNNRQVCL